MLLLLVVLALAGHRLTLMSDFTFQRWNTFRPRIALWSRRARDDVRWIRKIKEKSFSYYANQSILGNSVQRLSILLSVVHLVNVRKLWKKVNIFKRLFNKKMIYWWCTDDKVHISKSSEDPQSTRLQYERSTEPSALLDVPFLRDVSLMLIVPHGTTNSRFFKNK